MAAGDRAGEVDNLTSSKILRHRLLQAELLAASTPVRPETKPPKRQLAATHEDRFALDEVSPFVLLAAAVRQARRRPGASLPVQRQDVGSVVRGPRSRRGSS